MTGTDSSQCTDTEISPVLAPNRQWSDVPRWAKYTTDKAKSMFFCFHIDNDICFGRVIYEVCKAYIPGVWKYS